VSGWLQAFAAHPRIGDVASLRAKYGAFERLSQGEQAAAAASGSDDVFEACIEPHGAWLRTAMLICHSRATL
jgi:hypothetical protein